MIIRLVTFHVIPDKKQDFIDFILPGLSTGHGPFRGFYVCGITATF